ncbi:MAG: ral stress protein [Verrucomicrobiota bacterium]|jgi:large subunit ribosomal protein L25
MAKQIKLSAQTRVGGGRISVNKIRAQGKVPAVIYGATVPAMNLELVAREFSEVLAHASGEQILVELQISGAEGQSSKLALIQEVQHDPVRRNVLHVDFHAVNEDEKIHAHVTVEAVGEAVGVKTYGGLLVMLLHSVEVECLPKDLPEIIRVDVSALNVDQSIHLRDLQLPAGVSYRGDGDITVLRIAPPTTGEVVAAEGAASQPEVIREKKVDAEKK